MYCRNRSCVRPVYCTASPAHPRRMGKDGTGCAPGWAPVELCYINHPECPSFIPNAYFLGARSDGGCHGLPVVRLLPVLHEVNLVAGFTLGGGWEGAQIIKGTATKPYWLRGKFCRICHGTNIQYFVYICKYAVVTIPNVENFL